MLKITGYSNKISVVAGEDIQFYIHCEENHYTAQLVRIRCGDLNPEGPGLKEDEIEAIINKQYPGRAQTIHSGSYAVIPFSNEQHIALSSEIEDQFCFEVYVFPTAPQKKNQYIIDHFNTKTGEGFYLKLSEKGIVQAKAGFGKNGSIELSSTLPLMNQVWYRLVFAYSQGKYWLIQKALDVYHQYINRTVSVPSKHPITIAKQPIIIGGRLELADKMRIIAKDTFNGKIDSPALVKLKEHSLQVLPDVFDHPVIQWDFSINIPTIDIKDVGKYNLHGYLENMPTRGVTGYRYNSEATSWQHQPDQYSAIYFHDDDVYDAKWEADFSFQIPETLKSGLYAVRLKISDQDEYIPFVIRPGKNHKRNDMALLFPTATYMAYANEHLATDAVIGELICQRAMQISPHQAFLNMHREYGMSLYDAHSDGSGVHYSSRLRPILNMRPKRLFGIGAGSSFLWQFNADTHITDWLEAKEFNYDMITDEDLEERGIEEIKKYRVLMSTTHPEYYSTKMFKALEDFLGQGGRLMYMGGNGFYWRIAFHQQVPGVIEVRRTPGGTRAWETGPGEGMHSFTGEAGGIWRHQNRSPNKLCGIGFAAQGFDHSSYYRRLPESNDPRAAFIFDGIDDEILGDFGLIGGGAAGMEIDRYDPHLGSPRHALVLASSEKHTAAHVVVVEDIYNNYLGTDGEQNTLVRADMTFFETPSGGAVFSTGSISWSSALWHNQYKNNISQITYNVLKRFISPNPFIYPHDEYKEKPFYDEENSHQQMGS